MKTRAAILRGTKRDWEVHEIDLDPPKQGEVLVQWEAAGLCHSDEHLRTGDIFLPEDMRKTMNLPDFFPTVGGHEGAGVVLEVGEGVTSLSPGDHVATSFVPACGRCRWCVTGHSNLCDLGSRTFGPGQISDGTSRHHLDGQDLNVFAKLGTFAEHGVIHEASAVKVDPDLPGPAVALVSCGVTTGFGSAVYRADVQPGETVVVVGVGGVGMSAVQGARLAGAKNVVAVDPIEFKRKAALGLGATHTARSASDALPLVRDLTQGAMADAVILTVGVLAGEDLGEGLALTGKNGTCVVTAGAPITMEQANINLYQLGMWQKEVRGVLFGSGNPRFDIPNILSLYKAGVVKLDEMVTRTYSLEDINQGYADMYEGLNIRGVISFID